MAITRAEFLARASQTISNMPRDVHHIPGFGEVAVRGMSAKERDRVLDRSRIKKGPRRGETDNTLFRTQVLLTCVINEDGTPFFEASDVDLVLELPPGVMDGLVGAVNKLSGFGEEEEVLGNGSASAAASDDSASSSRSNSGTPSTTSSND